MYIESTKYFVQKLFFNGESESAIRKGLSFEISNLIPLSSPGFEVNFGGVTSPLESENILLYTFFSYDAHFLRYFDFLR